MSSVFNVIKCYNCSAYQVDQHKQSTNKWTCKLCGEKQSLKQIFYQGDSKECRLKVQHLNMIMNESKNNLIEVRMQMAHTHTPQQVNQVSVANGSRVSKWMKYLNENEDD